MKQLYVVSSNREKKFRNLTEINTFVGKVEKDIEKEKKLLSVLKKVLISLGILGAAAGLLPVAAPIAPFAPLLMARKTKEKSGIFEIDPNKGLRELDEKQGRTDNKPSVNTDTIKFSVTKKTIKNLKSNTGLLGRSYDNLVTIRDCLRLLGDIDGSVDQIQASRENMERLEKDAKACFIEARKMSNALFRGNIPQEFKDLTEAVTEDLREHLDGYYDESLLKMLLTVETDIDKNDIFVFTHYIQFNGLTNSKGFQYDEGFYIILTAKIKVSQKRQNISYYVQTSPRFVLPGQFDPGDNITDDVSAKQSIKIMLEAEDIVALERKPFPFNAQFVLNHFDALSNSRTTTEDFKEIADAITHVEIKDDILSIYIDSDNVSIKNDVPIITGQLGMMLRKKRVRRVEKRSKYKRARKKGSTHVIHYELREAQELDIH